VRLTPFAFNVHRPEMNIHVTDVITAANGSPLAAGFMTWGQGSFPWTLNYDEIDFVIDGQLEVRLGNQVILGNPGDVNYIPKGSNIFFGSPTRPKCFMTFRQRGFAVRTMNPNLDADQSANGDGGSLIQRRNGAGFQPGSRKNSKSCNRAYGSRFG
jgi:hypothetical protein